MIRIKDHVYCTYEDIQALSSRGALHAIREPVRLEYDMVTTDDEGALLSLVNMALREGWQLQGGLSLAVVASAGDHEGYTLYGQALVRERHDTEEPPPCSH